MKKLLPRLALLAAPFLVYFALFFAFEPYDYFGLKGGACRPPRNGLPQATVERIIADTNAAIAKGYGK